MVKMRCETTLLHSATVITDLQSLAVATLALYNIWSYERRENRASLIKNILCILLCVIVKAFLCMVCLVTLPYIKKKYSVGLLLFFFCHERT